MQTARQLSYPLKPKPRMEMELKDVIDVYLDYLEMNNMSGHTITTYSRGLLKFCKYVYERYNRPMIVNEITMEDVEAYLYDMIKEKGYKITTRNNALAIITGFYSFCDVKGYTHKNIAVNIIFINEGRREKEFLTEEEVLKIIDTSEIKLIKLVLQTFYYTGLRISELTNLKVKDVDLVKSKLYVFDGKGKVDRIIPISTKLKGLLIDYLNNWRNKKIMTDRFFTTRTGSISKEYIGKGLQIAIAYSGVESRSKITPHSFRHAFASNLVDKGVDVVKVQKLLGHKSLLTTGIYTHSNMDRLNDAVNKLK
jgi:integrase/recombinase XerD